ncbi:MAG: two-component sensor histidine kinase [Chitinophagaceae bacterium]|nr:two-component sensor histidine kinase [Chitinophagaceae bacterium]
MAASFKIKRLRTIYILYWFLLTYIIAALVWWFIALSQQNKMMTDYKLGELNTAEQGYQKQVNKINEEKRRKTGQYIGEGVTFFLLIVVGAVVVFRAVRRQFKQSQQQQNFMMAITHELKTPIAIAKLNLETLQKHKLPEEQQQQLISNTLQEAGRLNTLCNNLLLASKIESGDYEITTEKIDVGELVTESVNDFTMRFPKRNIDLNVSPGIYLTGDRLLLQMAVNNLIDNAIKYSGKEEKVEVSVKKENDEVRLLIKDEGKGIPDDEKNKVFIKFYRVGNLHTKEAKGTGLGLYLTKKIVEQHNGHILLADNEPRGSIFEVKL